MQNGFCKLPEWYSLPGEYDPKYCIGKLNTPWMGGSPLGTKTTMRPFTCDPVGHVMALGWRDD